MMRLLPRNTNYGLTLFDDFFNVPTFRDFTERNFMNTDIREKDGNYIMDIDMPGADKENINITLQDGYLTVSSTQNQSKEEKDEKGNIIHQERYSGSMRRSYYVGDAVDEDSIKASFKDGILSVTFPKENPKVIEKKTITIE